MSAPSRDGLTRGRWRPGSGFLLPLNGLLIAVFLGWVWKRHDALQACGTSGDSLGRLWRFNLRYVVPLLVLLVLAQSIRRA